MNNTIPTTQLVHIMPNDVIVASHSGELNTDEKEEVKRRILAYFPANPVLVHDSRLTLSIHRPPPKEQNRN